MIRSYDLQPDGTVRNMRVLYDFSPGRGADGMSIDTQGNLYTSAGMNQLRGTSETLDTKAGVYVISPEGKLLKFIPIAEDFITNNAFGGADMKTLYVTAGKTSARVSGGDRGPAAVRRGEAMSEAAEVTGQDQHGGTKTHGDARRRTDGAIRDLRFIEQSRRALRGVGGERSTKQAPFSTRRACVC